MNAPITQDKVLLRPSDIQPVCPDWEVIGVFNPGAARYKDEIMLVVRVAEMPRTHDPEQLLSPRAIWPNGEIKWTLDSFDPAGADTHDPRFFRLPDGRVRLRYISHLRLVRLSSDGSQVKEVLTIPDLLPSDATEEFGVEDARITQIDDTYYITYVAVSRQMGVATALITTHDFKTFERHGIIFPTENKDVVLLPEKWDGYYVAYHRPVSDQWFDAPSVETALSPDSVFWGKNKFLFAPRPGSWDSVKVGAAAPPVRLAQGWLFTYHGVSPPTSQSPVGRYCVGLALMDHEDPLHLLARSTEPFICPDRPYEQEGFAPNIIFPTGALISADQQSLILFNGAADEVVSQLIIPIQSILDHLGVN